VEYHITGGSAVNGTNYSLSSTGYVKFYQVGPPVTSSDLITDINVTILDDMVAGGIAEVGVRARNPDFIALAKAYGAQGVRARSLAAVEAAVGDALRREGPTLIEVHEGDFGGA